MSAKMSTFAAIYRDLRVYSKLYNKWDMYGLSDEENKEFCQVRDALDWYQENFNKAYLNARKSLDASERTDKYLNGFWLWKYKREHEIMSRAWSQFKPIPF